MLSCPGYFRPRIAKRLWSVLPSCSNRIVRFTPLFYIYLYVFVIMLTDSDSSEATSGCARDSHFRTILPQEPQDFDRCMPTCFRSNRVICLIEFMISLF